MKKQLLREWVSLDYSPDQIKEDMERTGKIVIPAILQKSETKNQNGRKYPDPILKREIANYENVVRERRSLGELDHPDTSTVALDRVSHLVTEIKWDGNIVRGKVEVLDTPKGKILESLLKSGVRVGISSRGVGSTNTTTEGIEEVQDDFQLICFDVVSEPSTPGAYLNETRYVDFDRREVFTRTDRIWRALNALREGRGAR